MLALAALASACGSGINDPAAPADIVVEVVMPNGLRQTVRVTPAEPEAGDTMSVFSAVTNTNRTPVEVQSRICGLDLAGTLAMHDPFARCAGYSMSGPLAAGASREQGDARVITSGPGRYTLRVRHLVEPEQWVELRVTVR